MTKKANQPDHRLFFPATDRNREPIFKILQKCIPLSGDILEIASGSGQHVTYFAKKSPKQVKWHPSEANHDLFPSISSWTAYNFVNENVNKPNEKSNYSKRT